jgi:hypothetical protein
MNNQILDLVLQNKIYNLKILSKISQISKYYYQNTYMLWKNLDFQNSKYINYLLCSCNSITIPNINSNHILASNFRVICKHKKKYFISSLNAIDDWFLEWSDLINLSPYIFTNQIRLNLMYNKKDVIQFSIIKHTPKLLNNKIKNKKI